MKRYWIWMIPILAAVSAFWIQAALHDYNPGAVTREPTASYARHDRMEVSTITPIYSENAVNTPPRPAEQPH
jgi:hypothetical protein